MLAPKSDVDPNAGNDRRATILFLLAWAWTVVPKVIQTIAAPEVPHFCHPGSPGADGPDLGSHNRHAGRPTRVLRVRRS